MLELSRLAAMRNVGHRPTHLIHAALGHNYITPATTIANYPMANSSVVRLPFPRQDVDYGWINERVSGCMEVCA
jgi:hypothetical protein